MNETMQQNEDLAIRTGIKAGDDNGQIGSGSAVGNGQFGSGSATPGGGGLGSGS
jgi:hypothetical protein